MTLVSVKREQEWKCAGNRTSWLSCQRCSFDCCWTKDCHTKDIAWTSWWTTVRGARTKDLSGLIEEAPCSSQWFKVLLPNPCVFSTHNDWSQFYSLRWDTQTFIFPGDGNHGTSKCLYPYCTLGVRGALSVAFLVQIFLIACVLECHFMFPLIL